MAIDQSFRILIFVLVSTALLILKWKHQPFMDWVSCWVISPNPRDQQHTPARVMRKARIHPTFRNPDAGAGEFGDAGFGRVTAREGFEELGSGSAMVGVEVRVAADGDGLGVATSRR